MGQILRYAQNDMNLILLGQSSRHGEGESFYEEGLLSLLNTLEACSGKNVMPFSNCLNRRGKVGKSLSFDTSINQLLLWQVRIERVG
jgi:hypothetical protein